MYNKDLKELSRDELEHYIHCLEIDLNLYKQYTKDLKHMLKVNDVYKVYRYKKNAHVYKVQMERYRRKLTRIYKLFDKYILTVLTHYPLASAESIFYIKCIEDMRKEIKNV